jgi:hypothetical protein
VPHVYGRSIFKYKNGRKSEKNYKELAHVIKLKVQESPNPVGLEVRRANV